MDKYVVDANFSSYTQDALLKCFWFKKDLFTYLVAIDNQLNTTYGFSDLITKRDFLRSYFEKRIKNNDGKKIICSIALNLIKKNSFHELGSLEDSIQKIAQAKEAIRNLNKYLEEQKQESKKKADIQIKREEAVKQRNKNIGILQTKEKLKKELEEIALKYGTQVGGYALEKWFYELAVFEEIQARPPYKNTDGRQVDGSITIDGSVYLIEIKNTKEKISVTDLDSFKTKVDRGIDNTMGILFSLAGFHEKLIEDASQKGSKILLIDHYHIYYYFTNASELTFIINRIRRHAAQTGEAYLHPDDF